MKYLKNIFDSVIAASIFSLAYFDLSWLPSTIQEYLLKQSEQQLPSADLKYWLYFTLFIYSSLALCMLYKVNLGLIGYLVERSKSELVNSLKSILGVLSLLILLGVYKDIPNAFSMGVALIALYGAFLYAPIWIGNTLIDAAKFSELDVNEAKLQGASKIAEQKSIRRMVAFFMCFSVMGVSLFGLLYDSFF